MNAMFLEKLLVASPLRLVTGVRISILVSPCVKVVIAQA